MASLLLRPLLRPQALGLGLGLTLTTYHSMYLQRPLLLDTALPRSNTYQTSTQSPPLGRLSAPKLNPSTVRQVSTGSILGLFTGVLVSTFSRSLALLLGLLVLGVQYASSKGINLIPYQRLQRYVHGIDLRSAVQDNAAFKLSFGTTFALAGFCSF